MPVSFHFDEGIIVIVAEGEYAPEAFIGALRDSVDKYGQSGRVPVLFDQTRSKSLAGRSTDELKDMAASGNKMGEFIGPRVAFVVSGDLEFGLDRMGSAYIDDILTVNVFRDLDAAREWLLEE